MGSWKGGSQGSLRWESADTGTMVPERPARRPPLSPTAQAAGPTTFCCVRSGIKERFSTPCLRFKVYSNISFLLMNGSTDRKLKRAFWISKSFGYLVQMTQWRVCCVVTLACVCNVEELCPACWSISPVRMTASLPRNPAYLSDRGVCSFSLCC